VKLKTSKVKLTSKIKNLLFC